MAIQYSINTLGTEEQLKVLSVGGIPAVCATRFPLVRVRPDDWLKEPYLYDQQTLPWNEVDKQLTLSLRQYLKKHPDSMNWTQRLRYQWLDSTTDQIAMLLPYGAKKAYLTFNGPDSKEWWAFICDLRNTLWDVLEEEGNEAGLEELRALGVNYAFNLPYTPDIVPNVNYAVKDKYKMPHEVIEAFRDTFWKHAWASFEMAGSHLDQIHWRLKKRTTWGPPFTTIDDEPYSKSDITYHLNYGKNNPLNLIVRPDYSGLKRPFIEMHDHPNSIASNFRRQIQLYEKYGPVNPENLHYYMDARAIGRSASNLRLNCPDGTLQLGHIKPDDWLFGKDRNLVMDDGNFGWLTGKGSTEKLVHYVRDKFGWLGAPNRARRICGFSTEDQFVLTLLCDCLLHNVEKGPSGFMANRQSVKDRHMRFCRRHKHVKIAVGDRSNAETFMTSNPDFMRELWDPGISGFINGVKGPVILPSASGIRCLSYEMASGKATTSFDNILPGNADKCWMYARAVYPHDVHKQAQAVAAIAECLMTGADEVEIAPSIFVCPYLSTDDIVDALGDDLDQPFEWKFDQDMLDGRKLSLEIVDSCIAYGMHVTNEYAEPSIAAGFKKCFTSEHMGFAFKDGFGTYARIALTGHSDVISAVLKRHFGIGAEGYEPYVPLYLRTLCDLGCDIGDEYNQYSPVEQMVFGPYREMQKDMNHGVYVDEDPTNSSSVIREYDKQYHYDLIKKTLYASRSIR